MKKMGLVLALAMALVFAFCTMAMADHSPQFYFDFSAQPAQSASLAALFTAPVAADIADNIQNGLSPHGGYSATTAKCSVCHSVHRAPSGLPDKNGLVMASPTSATNEDGEVIADYKPTASSRYVTSAWFGSSTGSQVLLRSTISASCTYCHSSNMFGGYVAGTDEFNNLFGTGSDPTMSWNSFYSHTTGCTSCHSVHGAKVMTTDAYPTGNGLAVLKYSGINNVPSGAGVDQGLQPNLIGGPLFSGTYENSGSFAHLTVKSGIEDRRAVNTALCTNCHANYSPAAETIINGTKVAQANSTVYFANLFGATNWTTYDPATQTYNVPDGTEAAKVPIGTDVYGQQGNGWLFTWKNHPNVAPSASYATSAYSTSTTKTAAAGSAKGFAVADADSLYCQSCHNSPARNADGSFGTGMLDGSSIVQSYPHYMPGYYKFMAPAASVADNYAVVTTLAELREGRAAFFESKIADGKSAAIMSDTYCLKCHSTVGSIY